MPFAQHLRLRLFKGFAIGDVHVDVGKRAREDAIRRNEAIRKHLHRNGETVDGRKPKQRIGVVAGRTASARFRDDAALFHGAAHNLMIQQKIIAHTRRGDGVHLVLHALHPDGFLFLGHAGRLSFKFFADQFYILLIAFFLRKARIDAGQLLAPIEYHILKGEKHVGIRYRLADLCIGQHALRLKAPVGFRARGIIHVPAALILIVDMIGFQPLLPECGVLRIDEMAVCAHDQRNAVPAVQLQEKLVELPLLFCIVILHLQHEAVAEVLGKAKNQLFCFLFTVLEHAGDAGGGHKDVFGIEGQQQFHVHAGTIVKAADIRLRQGKVQIAHTLSCFGRQNDVAVGVVLLVPVLDEIGFGNIAPAQAVLFRQQRAFAIVSLIAVLAGGKNAVPKLRCAFCVVLVGHYAVRQHDVADAGMPVVADVWNLKILHRDRQCRCLQCGGGHSG